MAEPSAEREARRWLAQARHDLADARFAAEGGRHALACFLCHQSAEKAVGAFLFANGAERVWGNALADLCEDAMVFDASFDVVKSVALLLDKHFLASRYPSALPGGVPWEVYEAEDSRRALEIAADVLAAVEERLDGATFG